MTTDKLETARLVLTPLSTDDAPDILRLVNEPGWLAFIGDRNVHSEDDARGYLERGPLAMATRTGYVQFAVRRKSDGAWLGMCGLLKRDTLPDPDLGFAFLAEHHGQGYAREAADAVMEEGKQVHGVKRILGITVPENASSIRLLKLVGMAREGTTPDKEGEPPLELYAWNAER